MNPPLSLHQNDSRRIIKNSVTLIGTRSFIKIATTVLTIFIARKLGEEQFGVFSALLAFVALFSILTEFGLTVPLIRTIAARNEKPEEALSRVIVIKSILGIIAFLLLSISAFLLDYPLSLALLFGTSMFFEVQVISVIRSFEGLERMKYVAFLNVTEKVILCISGFSVLYFGGGLLSLAVVYVLTYVSVFIVGISAFIRCFGPLKINFNKHKFTESLRNATPFLVASVFSLLYNRTDIFILTLLKTSSEIGWYNAAFRVIDAYMFIPLGIVGALFPVLTRYHKSMKEQFTKLYVRSLLLLLTLGVLISVGTFTFADKIIEILYADQYSRSVELLKILSIILSFYFINFLLGSCLIAAGKESLSTLAIIFGGIMNVILNVILVPVWSLHGAALARVGTEILACFLQLYYLYTIIGTDAIYLWPKMRKVNVR